MMLIDLGRHIEHRLIPGLHLQHVGDEIAMQKHCTLGDTGGAAGVLEECNIVRPYLDGRQFGIAAGGERVVEARSRLELSRAAPFF